jgi:chemotaxis protein methyltransferase CheR
LSVAAAGIDYEFLRRVVLGCSQNVLDPSRDYLFDSRLARLLRNHGMTGLDQLVDRLRARRDSALERAVAEAMTINETSFFRDQRPFELLRAELLPRVIERRRSARGLRFWSAGCSTGQEALSIALLLREHFSFVLGWNIQIDGTDISCDVVERARAGRYHRIEVNRGLPARYLVKYFEQDGEDWVARNEIRAMCNFRQANLCAPRLPFSRRNDQFDLILLRNVMLYFSPETRAAVLNGLHGLIAPDGILLLGSSEQADSSLWTPVVAGGTVYYQPNGSR